MGIVSKSCETQLLVQAKTKHAREFKEAWHSVDKNTINRHIDIPPVFLQLKNSSNLNNSVRELSYLYLLYRRFNRIPPVR